MFYKKGVLRKFHKNHRKIPVPESFLITFQAYSDTGIFLSILQEF